jgi:hypothetical protein
MKPTRLVRIAVLAALASSHFAALGQQPQWDVPTEALATQIAAILGPGQAHLTIRNSSTLRPDEIPAIRRQLEADLKSHGITASGAESANAIRVTLGENVRERLWVAEVVQGNETRVAMVHVEPGARMTIQGAAGLTLRRQPILTARSPVLALVEFEKGAIAVDPDEIVLYGAAADGLHELKRIAIAQRRQLARDARGVANLSASGADIDLPAVACSVTLQPWQGPADWTVHCHDSDDPWPIAQVPDLANAAPPIKAFYNAARNYFTGVVTPSVGVDLPPFYTAALLPRPSGAALVIGGIDGKVQLVDNGALKAVAGARDWGSDFAAIHSGCGSGTQILAAGSGEAASDSLRAYELPAQEAVPASAALAMDGTVTALWTAPDGKSVFAVVRSAQDNYEVDRVTANCN